MSWSSGVWLHTSKFFTKLEITQLQENPVFLISHDQESFWTVSPVIKYKAMDTPKTINIFIQRFN